MRKAQLLKNLNYAGKLCQKYQRKQGIILMKDWFANVLGISNFRGWNNYSITEIVQIHSKVLEKIA